MPPRGRKTTRGVRREQSQARRLSGATGQTPGQALRNIRGVLGGPTYQERYVRGITQPPSAGTYGNVITPTVVPQRPTATPEPEYTGDFPLIQGIYNWLYDRLNRRR